MNTSDNNINKCIQIDNKKVNVIKNIENNNLNHKRKKIDSPIHKCFGKKIINENKDNINDITNEQLKDNVLIKNPIEFNHIIYEYNEDFHMYWLTDPIIIKYNNNLIDCLRKIEEYKNKKFKLNTQKREEAINLNIERFDDRIYFKNILNKFIPVFEIFDNKESNLINYYKKNNKECYNTYINKYPNLFNEDYENIVLINGNEDFEFEINKKNEKITRIYKPIYCVKCNKFINYSKIGRHIKIVHPNINIQDNKNSEITFPMLIETINNKIKLINTSVIELETHIIKLIKNIKENYQFIEKNINSNLIKDLKINIFNLQNNMVIKNIEDSINKIKIKDNFNSIDNKSNKYINLLVNVFNKEEFFKLCKNYDI